MRQLAFASALLIGGCVRSPEPRLYTLVAPPGSVHAQLSANVEVRRPRIAGYLDRHEIVLGVRSQQLSLLSGIQWAEPFDAMIARALATALAERLPRSRVSTDMSALGVSPDLTVNVEVQRFERDASGFVVRGLFALQRAGQSGRIETFVLTCIPSSADPDAQLAAMSGLLARLADRVAVALSLLPISTGP